MSLIAFKFGNFRSYKEDFEISLEAMNYKELEENYHIRKKKLLNSAIIYGANASGKSNILRAFNVMRQIVLRSVKREEKDQLPVEPFLLDIETRDSPSFFEITIFANNHRYRYGFEATKTTIKTEWFFWTKNVRESQLFLREKKVIKINNSEFEMAKIIKEIVPNNALLLAEAARYIHESKKNHAKVIMDFFHSLTLFNERTDFIFEYSATQILDESIFAKQIRTIIQKSDFGITNIRAEKEDIPEHVLKMISFLSPNLEPDLKKVSVKTTHQLFEEGKKIDAVEFDMDIHESAGTRKFFAIIGPIFDILKKGALLLIDEFDASLHPELSYELIKLFHSRKTNPNGAQLIITSHNSEFLKLDLFRRDQIWFVEKYSNEESVLYPLTDFKVKKQANIADLYKNGRFGAIPYLHNLYNFFISETINKEKI